MRSEAAYQGSLIKKLKEEIFPGCFVIKNDPAQNQGIPDLLILVNDRWGALEVKLSNDSSEQPNQDFFVELFNEMSFASFICPETEERVLDEFQQALYT